MVFRLAVVAEEDLAQLHESHIKISKAKYRHLVEIKDVIPEDCWAFYENLPHELE